MPHAVTSQNPSKPGFRLGTYDDHDQSVARWSPEGPGRHLWIHGPAGSGKTVTAQSIVVQARAAGWTVRVLDAIKTGREFRHLAVSAYNIATTPLRISAAIREIRVEMNRREAALTNARPLPAGCHGAQPPTPMLVVVEEPMAMYGAGQGEDASLLRGAIADLARIGRDGRAARIHLLLLSQIGVERCVEALPDLSLFAEHLLLRPDGATGHADHIRLGAAPRSLSVDCPVPA